MKKLIEMSGKELLAEYNKRSGKSIVKLKGTKVQIVKMIEALAPKATPAKTVSKRGPSTKLVLRALFKNKKVAFTMDELSEKMPTVKPNTIETALVDLKNPKWAGGAVLIIKRGEDNKYRIAK